MKKNTQCLALMLLFVCASAGAQTQENHPGAKLYTPTRIDWLTTTLQASLRQDLTQENGFSLDITEPDSETVLIYVRYLPDVNRTVMNMTIETARKVIHITAKSYGWDGWLKIREDVEVGKP